MKNSLFTRLLTVALLLFVAALSAVGQEHQPPRAAIIPKVDTMFGDIRIDNYYWLRDKESPQVLKYLEDENNYTMLMMQPTEKLQQQLFTEMLGRIKEDDASVPASHDGFFYYTRTETGKPYAIHCRKKGSVNAPEEVVLDENELAKPYKYFAVSKWEDSPDHSLITFGVDTAGSEQFDLQIKDLATGKIYPERIPMTYYDFAWANDNKTLFYIVQDGVARPYKLYRHTLGSDPKNDVMVYHEADSSFELSIKRSRSNQYLFLESASLTTTEIRYLDANTPAGNFKVIAPRRAGHEYSVDHRGDKFYILTNDQALNFKIVTAPTSDPSIENWKDFEPYVDSIFVTSIDLFANWLVADEWINGLPQLRIWDLTTGESHFIAFDEPAYALFADENYDFSTDTFRFAYSSMLTPKTVYDYDMRARTKTLKKQTEVLGGYDPSQYQMERIFARASDGVMIPITIMYKKGMIRDGKAPLWLYAYGAYGINTEPYFSPNQFSLLDRGMIYAEANIRGGSEMGRQWYYDGKLAKKRNTFTDFIASAEHLIAAKYTSSDRLVISGGSAGGLLIGAVVTMRPDLFKVAIADVPFVDVINTMLDENLPLTVQEFEEWGNPRDSIDYQYMRSYSPYDNIKATEYPNLLITGGLNDPRVMYWEPAKFAAKFRATKTDNNRLLLRTHMGTGHFGESGRYGRLKDYSFQVAFALDILGLNR